MRKYIVLALFALCGAVLQAATVDDLVAIEKNWTFIADDYTSNGTSGFTTNTLYAGGKIFSPNGNSVATNKGKTTIGGEEHFNSLRLKNVQDRLAFKVADSCTVVFYTQNHGTRGIVISKTDRTSVDDPYYASQPGNTPVWEVKLDEAGTYYLSNHDGDFFFAGFEVKFASADRDFTDFKIDFRQNPYTVLLPANGELPEGVELSGINYHGDQHGIQGGTIKVPVDGAVKFTIGACQFGNHTLTVKKNGEALTTIDNNNGCDNTTSFNQYVTWTYNVETVKDTLEFTLNGYMPYFFAEACDYIESVIVRYYDTDGTTILLRDTLPGGTKLAYKLGAADVTVGEGQAFRGWFASAAKEALKVAEGMPVEANLSLYAKASDIEVAQMGKYFYYDLSKNYFYQEDHELIAMTNGKYHNNHGWAFGDNGTIAVQVAGNAVVSIIRCAYSNDESQITCVDGADNPVGEAVPTKSASDGEQAAFRYAGDATTLTFTLSKGGYIHGVKVYNIENVPTENEAGYYVLNANDGAGLLLMLETANNGDKIFLPNGTYDFGSATLTNIGASISLIGESMEGVTIVNHPLNAGMNGSETFLLRANEVYMQDLAIRCDVSYPGSVAGGVGIALQIRGDKSICKRVDLQGNQDTYLSSGAIDQRGWFEDGRIEGTVDYICGGGNMWFENTVLYNNARGKADVILAPSTSPETVYGYVFNNCTVDGAAEQDGIWNIARGWQNSPAATWLNTTCKIAPSTKGYTNMGAGLVCRFHEYNTHLEDGTPITGHNLDGLGYSDSSDEIYLENAGVYTYENVILGEDNWDAAAIAAQVTADPDAIEAEAAYLIEDDGAFVDIVKGSALSESHEGKTIRQANTRGGFGAPVVYKPSETGIDEIVNRKSSNRKFIKDGQLVIIRDGVEYNVLGAPLR